ncbi:MAG TPA: hypothetical protein VFM23_05370 [Gemmatimonadales bacterium]|nr:hypothetical protein [Gemmatimonadales bacterium]
MTSIRRRASITLGLVGAGAISGAAAGTIALTAALLFSPPWSMPNVSLLLVGLWFGGVTGAPLGAIAAPLLGWTLLRRVPLGRMFAVLAAGTVIGGIVGWFGTTGGGDIVVNSIAGAALGCIVAAVNLWHRARAYTLEA